MRGGLVAQLYCLSSPNILLLGPSKGHHLALLFTLQPRSHTPASLPGCAAFSTTCVVDAPALSSFLGGGEKTNMSPILPKNNPNPSSKDELAR